MKTIVSIFFVLFAVVAVYSSPMPQEQIIAEVEQAAEAEATPNRPVLNAIAGLANTGMNIAKSVAETTGRFIEGSAGTVTSGINNIAHFTSDAIQRPFQAAAAVAAAPAESE